VTVGSLVYQSSLLRTPGKALVRPPSAGTEAAVSLARIASVGDRDHDLTAQHAGAPHGQRIVVEGSVLDRDGRPLPNVLIEIWQANAAGRYLHPGDQHSAPLDPNFTGRGRCMTDERGRYRFVTVKPGAYPWKNHTNAWRPAHIHFSLVGHAFSERLVTQMYFPDDPLFFQDPIFNAITDERARNRMIARFALEHTVPDWALGFAFDVVLAGPRATPLESGRP
jgi:protocatechuate 3,4-dioxygenase beta subunit